MELAAIITTLVVVLLQIITLSHVLGTRKMISELGRQKSNPSSHGERRERESGTTEGIHRITDQNHRTRARPLLLSIRLRNHYVTSI